MLDKGLSRQYINQLIDCIRRMFKWATAEQLIPSTVYQSLTAVSGLRRGRSKARETTPVLPIEDIVVNATLEHMPEVPADMVRLQLLTGMRPAEVCSLRPMDLERSSDVWIYRPASHKTEHHGRERVVFIGPQAQAVLLRYLARDASMRCFRPIDSEQKRRSEQHARRKTPLSCGNVPGSNRKAKPKRKLGEFLTRWPAIDARFIGRVT